MSQSILIAKISISLQNQVLDSIEVENQLLIKELQIQKEPSLNLGKKIAYIPDHLAFDCQEGVQIYQVEHSYLQSFIAVRH